MGFSDWSVTPGKWKALKCHSETTPEFGGRFLVAFNHVIYQTANESQILHLNLRINLRINTRPIINPM